MRVIDWLACMGYWPGFIGSLPQDNGAGTDWAAWFAERRLEPYLRMAADLGHVRPGRIEQRGETIASVQTNFELISDFKDLRLG